MLAEAVVVLCCSRPSSLEDNFCLKHDNWQNKATGGPDVDHNTPEPFQCDEESQRIR